MRILLLMLTLLGLGYSNVSNRQPLHAGDGTEATEQAASTTRTDLAKVAEQWATYWRSQQLDPLVALYADDAVFLTGQGDRFTGKSVIRDIFRSALQTNKSNLTVRSVRTEVSDNLAFDSGEYHEVITPSGGEKRELTGNYIIVFRKQGGKWLIVEHAWTDKPAKN